ncbi:MAG: hypothetical protein Q9162_003936 [Coniocarpon cinnabarinum]
MSLYSFWTQLFPPKAEFTEANLPPQKGKVCLVTGGTSGIGFELCKALYRAGAKVYLTARTKDKAEVAIKDIKKACQDAAEPGDLDFLELELSDLSTIKASADSFLSQEKQLDVLWNNAGVGGTTTAIDTRAGHGIHIGTNALGPFLFTKCLLPVLKAAPASRVIWSSSMLVETAVKGGFDMQTIINPPNDSTTNYVNSKTANWFLAFEFARRYSDGNIISITQNPGNLRTLVWRHEPWWVTWPSWLLLLWPQHHGAHTALWAGLSPQVTLDDNGKYVVPWGRWHPCPRPDLLQALKTEEEGGTGRAAEFFEWCERETVNYL